MKEITNILLKNFKIHLVNLFRNILHFVNISKPLILCLPFSCIRSSMSAAISDGAGRLPLPFFKSELSLAMFPRKKKLTTHTMSIKSTAKLTAGRTNRHGHQ
jgi:hypothetical protein